MTTVNVLSPSLPANQVVEMTSTNLGGAFSAQVLAVNIAAALPAAGNTAALATPTFANQALGTVVYVSSQLCSYVAVPTGDGDIAGTGQDWKRIVESSSPTWRSQATWSVDPVGGSDDNTGIDDAHALKSTEEWTMRMGGPAFTLAIAMTLRILGNVGVLQAYPTFTNAAGQLIIDAPVASTVLAPTAVLAYTAGTDTHPPKMTLTAIADITTAGTGGTTLVSNDQTRPLRGRLTSGANAGNWFYFSKASPDSGDTNATGRVQQLTTAAYSLTPAAIANGDNVTFELLNTIDTLDIRVSGITSGTLSATTSSVVIKNVCTNRAILSGTAYEGNQQFVCEGSIIRSLNVTQSTAVSAGIDVRGWNFRGCWLDVSNGGNVKVWSCLVTELTISGGALSLGGGNGPWSSQVSCYQGVAISVEGDSVLFNGCYVCDAAGASSSGIQVWRGTVYVSSLGLKGYNNANSGITFYGGSKLNYSLTKMPSITGIGGDILLDPYGGIGTGTSITWAADVPWVDGAQGSYLAGPPVTLANVGGVAQATVHYMPSINVAGAAQVIVPTWASAVGAGTLNALPGDMVSPNAIIKSSNVADVGKTVNWFSPPWGNDIHIVGWR